MTFHVKRIPAPVEIRGGATGDKVRGHACPDCNRVWNGKSTARYELHWRVVHGGGRW